MTLEKINWYRVFPIGGMGGVPPPHQPKIDSYPSLIKSLLAVVCSHCSCSVFVLISNSLET